MTDGVAIERFADIVARAPGLYADALRLREEHLFAEDDPRPPDPVATDRPCVHFVAVAGGEVAGTAQYDPESNRLRQMVVAPGWRRRGLGLELVSRVVQEATERGHRELLVHAWQRAARFYERAGFERAGEVETSLGVRCQRLRLPLAAG